MKSGRKVALKFSNMDDDEEEWYDIFTCELYTLVKLNPKENKSLAIGHFEECRWWNPYSQEMSAKMEPYTEMRITWYALQISKALAFAHERGVAHHDVKSSNVLINWVAGGKLLLTDFGSAVAPGEDNSAPTKGFKKITKTDKVDTFGLGCILFELLCCRKIVDLTDDKTLAEFIKQHGVEAALDLTCIQLPWLESSSASQHSIGYSSAL
eukprot:scaffold70800_cov68-Attheya_sp.AAC.1